MDRPLLDVLTWQGTVASDEGPEGYTLRLVLLALSARMLVEGTSSIRMSGDDLAAASGLSKAWAMGQALLAVEQGWLIRTVERRQGKGWRCWTYRPSLPHRFHVKNSDLGQEALRGEAR